MPHAWVVHPGVSTPGTIRSMSTRTRRAIGVGRISVTGDRDPEHIHSMKVQRAAMQELADREGWELLDVCEEPDVSGNAMLADRPGLSRAVAAVQTGAADVIVAATTERLWWNLEVRAQALRLIEGEGGEVWSADEARLSNATAADEFSGGVRLQADRFSRRQNAEKSRAAVQRAISQGIVPWPNIPPALDRTEHGGVVPNGDAGTVLEAFRLRADGATIAAVRVFLAEHGIPLSYRGVQSMLRDRLYLGEIHFGTHEPNLSAHTAIVDRELWGRAQRVVVPRGRRAKSDRLLARLDVLRCASCGARMVVGTQTQRGRCYPFYRCSRVREDCSRRVTISAEMVEELVVAEVRRALADVEGRASVEDNAREAEAELERAEANLKTAIRAFTAAEVEDEQATVERLAELRAIRDGARERVDRHSGSSRALVLSADRDWDRLSLDARRALIRATVAEVRVAPGRGAERVTVKLVGE
jgi:DNA invertase Pin-like site-specific DNA recombinase